MNAEEGRRAMVKLGKGRQVTDNSHCKMSIKGENCKLRIPIRTVKDHTKNTKGGGGWQAN